jgi:hypothetical protein
MRFSVEQAWFGKPERVSPKRKKTTDGYAQPGPVLYFFSKELLGKAVPLLTLEF